MGKVIAICTSKHKGTLKNEVSEANFIEEFGIEGDAHAGKWHRQVSLLALEKIEDFRNKGGNVDFGAFGENLVIEGFELNKLPVGQWLTVGDDVLLGWRVNIRDSDGHSIYDDITKIKNPIQKNITIGNHVWIASYVDILKGTEIKDNSVIAYRSCVLSKFDKANCIIGGYPAKILRENINWEK